MKRYKVECKRFRFSGTCTYCYAVVDLYTSLLVKTGFNTGWEAISWAITDGNISIVDLDTSNVY